MERGALLRRSSVEGLGELGVVAHPVAVASDVDDVAVMEQAVDERGSHSWRE